MDEIATQILVYLFENFPNASLVFLVIGVLRAINKPLFALLRSYVLATPSVSDDAVLDGVEQSKVYKAISFVLDWSASIKLPPKPVVPVLPVGNAPVEPKQ